MTDLNRVVWRNLLGKVFGAWFLKHTAKLLFVVVQMFLGVQELDLNIRVLLITHLKHN